MGAMTPDRERILEEIFRDLGEPGKRASSFLRAADHLASSQPGSIPKSPELASYAFREALMSLTSTPDSTKRMSEDKARELLRLVDELKSGVVLEEVTGTQLRLAADDLRNELDRPTHAQRMINLYERRMGTPPPGIRSDPGTEYAKLIDDSNSGLHDSAGDVLTLLDQVFTFLATLFTPPDEVLEDLRSFIELAHPTEDDMRELTSRLSTAAQMNFFFRNAVSTEWLGLLAKTPFAHPDERILDWPASQLAISVAQSGPEAAAGWLGEVVVTDSTLNSLSVFHYTRTAMAIGGLADRVLATLLRKAPTDHSAVNAALWTIQRRPAEDPLCDELADLLLNDLQDPWLVGEMTKVMAAGVTPDNAQSRLKMLAHKIQRGVTDQNHYLPPAWSFAQATELESATNSGFETLLAGAAAVARSGLHLGLKRELLDVASTFPSPLDRQLQAWLMTECGIASAVEAREVVSQNLQEIDPTTDHFGLIDHAWASDPLAASDEWTAILGTPPSVEDAAAGLKEGRQLAQHIFRVRKWCGALPEEVGVEWRRVIEEVTGTIPGREALVPTYTWAQTFAKPPITEEALGAMTPEDAIDWLVTWRPRKEDWPTDEVTLGEVFQRVVASQPERWSPAVAVAIRQFVNPIYVAALLQGLATRAETLVAQVDLVEIGVTDLRRLADEAGTAEPRWQWAVNCAIELLEGMAREGADVVSNPELIDFVISRARDRSDATSTTVSPPWDQALNRGSMKALSSLIVIAAAGARAGRATPRSVLDTLDETLALLGDDGLQARSVVIERMNDILEVSSDWLDRNEGRLFGREGPGDVGQETAEILVQLTSPTPWTMSHLREQIYRAVEHGIHRGTGWLLVGLLDGLEGYSVEDIVALSRRLGPEALSAILAQLGVMLRPVDAAARIERGIAFARALLEARLAPSAYAGLGRWSAIQSLDDSDWLDLNLRATQFGTDMENLDDIAARAAEIPTDDALVLLTLLIDRPDTWQSRRAGDSAVVALRDHEHPDCEPRTRLRNALLRHGHRDAENL